MYQRIENSKKEKVHTFLEQIDKLIENNTSENSKFYYRGLSDSNYQLIPSIAQNRNWLTHEIDMMNAALNGRPDVFRRDLDDFEKMTLLQHYGVPTRLMDITSNVLVALYFACRKEKKKSDGVVYVFKTDIHNINGSEVLGEYLLSDNFNKKGRL